MEILQKTAKPTINKEKLYSLLTDAEAHQKPITPILNKALQLKGLTLQETAELLAIQDEEAIKLLLETAGTVKREIYGRRIVLFAPLYIGNVCSNDCLYCAFRAPNTELIRKRLTLQEIEAETRALLREGHKRLLMLAGEEAESRVDALIKAIETVYSIKEPAPVSGRPQSIRRINVEVAPMSVEDFRKLKSAKIGTYACFQETYDPELYAVYHKSGPKADYEWRLSVMDRAMEAGIEDVGIGALFGLTDYRFEVLALLEHARHLEERFGCGCHTISIPRIEPALGAPASEHVPKPVSDKDFKKLVAVLRLALPYTGIILSTRETEALRNELFNYGVSQISAGSRTNPGAYAQEEHEKKIIHNSKQNVDVPDQAQHNGQQNNVVNHDQHSAEQFQLGDHRSLKEVVMALAQQGYVPSFCTGCYRKGRVGSDFMDLAKPGLIQEFCEPNAFFTCSEYIEDFLTGDERMELENRYNHLIASYSGKINAIIEDGIRRIKAGERDVYV